MRVVASTVVLSAIVLGQTAGCIADAAETPHTPPTILLIWEQAPEFEYVQQVNRGFRDHLAQASKHATLFIEYQDELRFGDRPVHGREFLHWLHQKYAAHRIDLIAVAAQTTLLLVTSRSEDMWPGVPVTYGTLGHLTVDIRATHPEVSGLVLENYFPEYLQVIRRLLPQTRRIAIIQGASPVERERAAWWAMQVREQRFEVLELVGLPPQTLMARLGRLPQETVGFYFGVGSDTRGRSFFGPQAIRRISAAANRPLFGLDGQYVGAGLIGGPVVDWHRAGQEYARHVLERLDGVPARIETLAATAYTSMSFDARQLERWAIPEHRLPAGSSLRFREPRLWRDHRGVMIAVLAVGVVQTSLIIAILLERRNRTRAKRALVASYAQLRNLTKKLITAQEEERTRIARDLQDELGQRVASFSIALSQVKRVVTDQDAPVREELAALQRQAATLSADLRDLSHDLHPGALEHLGLLAALRAHCDDFSAENGVQTQLCIAAGWRDVPQPTQLCLYRVAQEALRNVAQHAQARQVQVTLDRQERHVVMQVADDGRGFECQSNAGRSGLGLVSLRERVRMLGGRLDIRAAPSVGTTLIVTLPDGDSHAV